MANKKLKVEVELETAKAKRQAKELAQPAATPGAATPSVSPTPRPASLPNALVHAVPPAAPAGGESPGGSSGSSSAAKLSRSLDKAARAADKSSSSLGQLEGKAGQLTKGFAGIAVGMAASYAANYATGGTKTALEYGGSAVTGAVSGAMLAGPLGAIIGGLAGVANTYMGKEAERSAMSKDFETGEAVYAATQRDLKQFDRLSTTKQGTDIAGNLAEAKQIIDNYTDSAAEFVRQIRKELKKHDPDKEKLEKLRRNLGYSRAQISKYESLVKTLEDIQQQTKDPRASTEATDALGKVGIAFARARYFVPPPDGGDGGATSTPGGGAFNFGFSSSAGPSITHDFSSAAAEDPTEAAIKIADEITAKNTQDMLSVLEDIAENTKNGGMVWQ